MKLQVNHLQLYRQKQILENVSFEVPTGEILLILGPSGAGKSTLLRCLNRLDLVDSGEILVDGKRADSLEVTHLRRRMGMVFQVPSLMPDTVRANILLGPTLNDRMLEESRCLHLLDQVGLPLEIMERKAESLSVGEKQRVALAQVLANQPEILLLDEPTSALDPTAVLTIENLIKRVHRELKVTILLVTHDLNQALRFNAMTLVMVEGRVLARGNIQDLMQDMGNETLKRFFEGRLGPSKPTVIKGGPHEH
jgi:putative ABC transport system ATP-binding protein